MKNVTVPFKFRSVNLIAEGCFWPEEPGVDAVFDIHALYVPGSKQDLLHLFGNADEMEMELVVLKILTEGD